MTDQKPTPYQGRFMEEAELEAMIAAQKKPETDIPEGGEPSSDEEKTWKKRHGDLRRYSQEKEKQLQQQIDELRKQLTEVKTAKQEPYPTTPDAVEKWFKDFPETAALVQTYVRSQIDESRKELDDLKTEIALKKQEDAYAKAKQILAELHDDFFGNIDRSPEFLEWLNEQPVRIKDTILVDNDPYAAARTIDLYKMDRDKKARRPDKEVAAAVKPARANEPAINTKGRVWKESEVQKLKEWEFEKYLEDIEKARQEGRYEYDLSGGAR
jgi:cell division septum initiation protein DivIVA